MARSPNGGFPRRPLAQPLNFSVRIIPSRAATNSDATFGGNR
jgi:hypothetical protein